MSRETFTYEKVKSIIESESYHLLSQIYIKLSKKLIIQCPSGHIFDMRFDSFYKNKQRCPECAEINKLNDIKMLVQEFGYELFSDTYKNNHAPLQLKCKNGHELKMSLANFKAGKRCVKCQKPEFEYIKETFLRNNFILLETEYKSILTKMKYKCIFHPNKIQYINFHNLKNKKTIGCPHCNKVGKINYDQLKIEFEKRNFTLLSTEYIKVSQKLEYICNKHPHKIQKITFNAIRDGQGCKLCANDKLSELKRHAFEDVEMGFDKKGYILLETNYKNSYTPLKYICPLHPDEVQELRYHDLSTRNTGCKYCGFEKNSGENNWNWKGGITPLSMHLRSCISQWKLDSAKKCNFKCVITGERFNAIHHLYPFHKIVEETLIELNLPLYEKVSSYSEDQLKLIEGKCLEIHYRYPLGICLREDVHNEYHSLYGYKDNTPEQFEQFTLMKNSIVLNNVI